MCYICIIACVYVYSVARIFGDPHIVTIDGRRYTFNGLGEYVLLRTNNFEFQGRTTLAPNSNATIFSAFALRENDNHIEVIVISVCIIKIHNNEVMRERRRSNIICEAKHMRNY